MNKTIGLMALAALPFTAQADAQSTIDLAHMEITSDILQGCVNDLKQGSTFMESSDCMTGTEPEVMAKVHEATARIIADPDNLSDIQLIRFQMYQERIATSLIYIRVKMEQELAS